MAESEVLAELVSTPVLPVAEHPGGEQNNCETPKGELTSETPKDELTSETPKKKTRYQKRGAPYQTYTPEQKAMIGKYAAEHGNTRAAEHFSKEFGMRIAESTVRLHKKSYYALVSEGKDPGDIIAIPSARKGRPRTRGGGTLREVKPRIKTELMDQDGEGGSSETDIEHIIEPTTSTMNLYGASGKPLVLIVACIDGQVEAKELANFAEIIPYPELTNTEQLSDEVCSQVFGLIAGNNCLVNRPLLDRCPKLRVVVRFGIGYDNIDVEYAGGLGIIVCNVPDYCIEEVADTAFAHILGLFRQTVFLHQAVCRGELIGPYKELFSAAKASRRIRGKTLGLVGLGRTGAAVALRAKAFGLNVVYYDPFVADGWDRGIGGLERFHSLTELVKRSDCVSLHCMLTSESFHIINESMLRIFKRGAFLVNVSRGGLVDESALANALKQGWIAGAALDVHESEPFSLLKSPLKGAPNLICTPHVAWYSKESVTELRTRVIKAIHQAATSSDPSNISNCVNKQYLDSDAVQTRWN